MLFHITNKVHTAKAFPTNLLAQLKSASPKLLSYTPPSPKFRAAVVRTAKATVLIYANGSAVITKAKTKRSLAKARAVCFLALGIVLSDFRLVNIVGCVRLNRRLDLPALSLAMAKSIYIPEEHCGLLFYIGNVSVIAYHTGVLMFCGCRSYAQFRYVAYSLTMKFINSNARAKDVKVR